jgi:hypothetical protein
MKQGTFTRVVIEAVVLAVIVIAVTSVTFSTYWFMWHLPKRQATSAPLLEWNQGLGYMTTGHLCRSEADIPSALVSVLQHKGDGEVWKGKWCQHEVRAVIHKQEVNGQAVLRIEVEVGGKLQELKLGPAT